MKNLFLWYLPQAGLFCFGIMVTGDLEPPISGLARAVTGIILAAAYTGGANLILSLVARLRRKRGQASSEDGGLGARARLLRERPQDAKRVRVDKQLR